MRELTGMMAFCENKTECRRAYVLQHFGENFPREACRETCDNCRLRAKATNVDITLPAAAACVFLQSQRFTLTLKQVSFTVLCLRPVSLFTMVSV